MKLVNITVLAEVELLICLNLSAVNAKVLSVFKGPSEQQQTSNITSSQYPSVPFPDM